MDVLLLKKDKVTGLCADQGFANRNYYTNIIVGDADNLGYEVYGGL